MVRNTKRDLHLNRYSVRTTHESSRYLTTFYKIAFADKYENNPV